MSQEAAILQQQLWLLIDNLYKSGLTTPHIRICSNFSSIDGNKYSVEYLGRDGFSLNFITSDSYGVWGINKIITIDEIIRLIKEEIRNSKLDHLLK